MSTALDLASLAAQGELKIPIARGVVSQGGSGTDYTGWSGVSSVFVEAKVEVREQSRGFATLTLTVEGSSNGSDWSTLETFTFGTGGSQSATVSAPDDHLRVSWAVGGHSEWQIIEVTAAPSIIDTGGGGGGSQPSTFARASYSGGTVTIANNGNVRLTWTTLGQGNALLDLSDPEAPTVVAGGIYSITATIVCLDFLTSGGCFKATLHLDAQNEDAVCIMTGGNQLAGDQDAYVSINNSYYIPAGGEISVSIVNKDGSASRDFVLEESIIQLIAPES